MSFARPLIIVIQCAALAVLLTSCDRRDPVVTGTVVEDVQRPTVEMRLLTQLVPGRQTHVTVDQIGNVYWTQENPSGGDENVMLTIGESGVPRVTQLSAGNILKEMGVNTSAGNVTGVIQDIRASEGAIYFFFTGGQGRASRVCLGQFYPRTGMIRIVADTKRLAELSHMGNSLPLARASLVVSGSTMWLWLRHSDASTFLTFEPRSGAAQAGAVDLQRPFERVTVDDRPLALTREDLEIATGFDGTVLISDGNAGIMWEIDPFGRATTHMSLRGLPQALSAPLIMKDKLVIFAGDADPIGGEEALINTPNLPKVQYPALLRYDGTHFTTIPYDDLHAYSGFPVYALRFARMIRESPDRLVAYDPASGALMRLNIPKDW